MNDSPGPRSTSPTEAKQKLLQPVQFCKGVGPQRAELLNKLGIRTIADLLFYFPRTYQDFSETHSVDELQDGEPSAVVGFVADIDHKVTYSGSHVFYLLLDIDKKFLKAVWFNQSYLIDKIHMGQKLMLRGKPKLHAGRFTMNHPQITWLEETADHDRPGNLLPVYRLTDGLRQRGLREMIDKTLEGYAGYVLDAFPESFRESTGMCDIRTALRQIHFPQTEEERQQAHDRLAYQELLVLQLALAMRRHRVRTTSTAVPMEMSAKIRSRILRRLPFELTSSQTAALDDIAKDMALDFPMNRLLHGEVGSGKTAVAVCTMLVAVANGYQAALMAPTEILAQQHFQTLKQRLSNSNVDMALLTGSLKTGERRAVNESLSDGTTHIVVGTHAILSRSTSFANLGLVVIDEQHKFGVRQRAQLRQSDHDPHYLVMTATPIPRTVSMTLFGDLDVSVLDKPAGVGNVVHTYLGDESAESNWWEFVSKKIREGRQAYVVAPLVASDEDTQLSSAERLFEGLANGPLEPFRLDVLHGRQTPEEKTICLQKFYRGETQVLVATGVIEVGINVPNATVMTIFSAERFGLSQLHQLRGRVARGKFPGFVCAFDSGNDPEANERLTAFKEINNGFELAERDLQIRGPGDLFSTSQSGFPPLKIANLIDDAKWVKRAQQDARSIIERDPQLSAPGFERLKSLTHSRYGKALDISDVG